MAYGAAILDFWCETLSVRVGACNDISFQSRDRERQMIVRLGPLFAWKEEQEMVNASVMNGKGNTHDQSPRADAD